MGYSREATCKSCGHQFEAKYGGGMAFELLHCTRCGKTKEIGHSEVYKHLESPQTTETDFDAAVEALAGDCRCGGSFRLDAPVRCPKCRSTEIEDDGGVKVCYD